MKRVFVAILLNDDVKNYVSEVQSSVQDHASKGKFHIKSNFHLTIEFIGMMSEKSIDPLWCSIIKSIEDVSCFDIKLDHLGYFEKKNKKIPWIGVKDASILVSIQKKVVNAVAQVIDHPTDHDYTPHITLGRQVVIEEMPEMTTSLNASIKHIALMESSSVTGTLLYTPLYVYEFL